MKLLVIMSGCSYRAISCASGLRKCVNYAEVTAHAMSLRPGAYFLGDFESLDGGIGSEPTCDWVSGAGDCKWCDSDGSGEDCWVSAESEVPSIGSVHRAGGRDRVMRLDAVMAAEGYLLRGSL